MTFPPQGNLPNPGIEPASPVYPALQAVFARWAFEDILSKIGYLKKRNLLSSESFWLIELLFVVVQSLSCVWLWRHELQHAGFPVLHLLPELLTLMSFESVMPPNYLVLCHPLLLSSIFPSIRISSNESALCIRWPNYWSFSFSISLSNEYLRLISFRIDCFNLLAAQGTLKSLLQHHSSKASILWQSAFFMVQLSDPCITTGKIIALTIRTLLVLIKSMQYN